MDNWLEVSGFEVDHIRQLAIDSINECIKDTNITLDYLEEKIEKLIGHRQGLYTKFLYFLAEDLEHFKIINPDCWYMTIDQVEKYIEEQKKLLKGDELKQFDDADWWLYEHCLDALFSQLEKEYQSYST